MAQAANPLTGLLLDSDDEELNEALPPYKEGEQRDVPISYEPDQEQELQRELAQERRENALRGVLFRLELYPSFPVESHFHSPWTVSRCVDILLDSESTFDRLQSTMLHRHMECRPVEMHDRSFRWSLYLIYTNGVYCAINAWNWPTFLSEIIALGNPQALNRRRSNFPTAIVTQSQEMSLEAWETVQSLMDPGPPGGEEHFLLRRGYFMSNRPASVEEAATAASIAREQSQQTPDQAREQSQETPDRARVQSQQTDDRHRSRHRLSRLFRRRRER